MTDNKSDQLKKIRNKITETDDKMAELFRQRMELVRQVGEYKKENALPVYDPERERQVLMMGADRIEAVSYTHLLHTILNACAGFLQGLPSMVSAIGMYIFQCLLSFIVPSGSGQASVSMPILAPLSDLVGISRQTACIAFQLGDGISNILTPTSGYFMACLLYTSTSACRTG